jgi:hypothetical protein
VGVLGAIIEITVLPVLDAGQQLPLGGTLALQVVGDHDVRDVLTPCEELAEERLCRGLISPPLHHDVQDVPLLIHGPPKILPPLIDGEEHRIKVPFVAWLRPSVSELIGVLLAKCPAPLADSFIRHDDASCTEQLFDVSIAEAETEIQPDAVADDLRREAMVLITVR